MVKAKRGSRGKRAKAELASVDKDDAGKPGLALPSPDASTNLVIADIVLRAAGGILRERMERGLLARTDDAAKADKLIDNRGIAASALLWGASSLARRSPLGLAVVAGGLAAKVFYDRGKRLEAKRRSAKPSEPDS
jgi:hypothetical protein